MDLNLLEEIITRYFNKGASSLASQHNGSNGACPIVEGLSSKCRKSEYVEARRVFVVICRAKYLMTYKKIGKLLNRHHSSIMHIFKSSINLSSGDSFFKNLETVMNQLKGG